MPRAIEDPILAYTAAEGEVNQIQWGATQPDWIAICYNKAAEILRVWTSEYSPIDRYSFGLLFFQTFIQTRKTVTVYFNTNPCFFFLLE